ncbi:beta-N-acetylhexosaminidase [Cryobacterium sp. MP_M5]|uniref:glycoside hydrolase family 3 N-terminal domain-containing protein n=1 Tax=unclassified Cryobacterium TaxID=2649013 RepID=UPI0018CA6DA9|nr:MULTISPECIES: glycoside hydrolase family 3 N-terminal domain-containing protein [unclassified Cryobacterium]MBG6057519.1 beta-N-acetylhexosaminidase [Cryobacterium sp. MP_M3]MEC5175966.1 beta-N-acetylhexosaminidase [Cryobacterium sp. MP_M5]
MTTGRVRPGRRRGNASLAATVAAAVGLSVVLAGCSPVSPSRGTGTPEQAAPARTGAPVDPLAADARRRLSAMTLTEKISSLLMLHQPGTDAAALGSFAADNGLGGLILMGDNVPPAPEDLGAMTSALSADAALPLLIGIDQEGGEVDRLRNDEAPGAEALRPRPVQATEDAFRSRAALLQSAGVSVNFGIVADVTADPTSFLYGRVLGTDPAAASVRVAAAVAGERGRVLSTLKHFPGHGAAPGDSHRSIPSAGLGYRDWLSQVAPPFTAGITAGAQVVMFGHLAYPAVDARPASLSPAWHTILRRTLGFTGIAITDDLLMLQDTGLAEYADPTENAIAAIAAGNTMLLYVTPADPARVGIVIPALVAGVAGAVESGRITQAQIDDAAYRLLVLRRGLAVHSPHGDPCDVECRRLLR